MFEFDRRRQALDVIPRRIRRLLDLTADAIFADDEPRRQSRRFSRLMPALLAPWQDDGPISKDACFVLTRSISDTGVGLILSNRFESPELCLGVMIVRDGTAETCFFLGTSRHLSPIGGGFWSLGVHLTACASETCPEKLRPLRRLAAQLTPADAITADK